MHPRAIKKQFSSIFILLLFLRLDKSFSLCSDEELFLIDYKDRKTQSWFPYDLLIYYRFHQFALMQYSNRLALFAQFHMNILLFVSFLLLIVQGKHLPILHPNIRNNVKSYFS